MANEFIGALQTQGTRVIEGALRGVVGQAVGTVADDDKFRAAVIDTAWNLMPTVVRLIGRERLKFDALFLGLRSTVFDLSGPQVQLRGDLGAAIGSALAGLVGSAAPAPASSPDQAPASSTQPKSTPNLPEPPAPPRPEPAVGIDLGTTFSVVAFLDPTGRPWTITNAEGDLTTPSVVLVEAKDSFVVGKEAARAAAAQPDQVAQFAKREMGSATFSRPLLGENYPPEVLQSAILLKLRRDAEDRVGPFRKAVITVPAYFNEPRRRATFAAGRLAGLDVLDIINEPTAAALAFGVQQGFLNARGEARQAELVLVYDLGGGTFDVTLMAIEGASYQARATLGDVHLGGIDWDERIANLIADEFRAKHRGLDPRQHPGGLQRLRAEAEGAKRALSARDRTGITFEHAGQAVQLSLTRDHFEAITRDLLERTRFTTNRVLRDAKVDWTDVTRILLVGGSTRMPMVAGMLEHESGLKVDRSLSPDESVAHGAAVYAGLLLAHDAATLRSVRVGNVSSHALGVLGIEPQTGRDRTRVMIPANTPLPATARGRFRTHRANQTSVAVRIIEGGDASGNGGTALGTCVVRDLPPELPARTPVEVVYRYDTGGVLAIEAMLPGLDRSATLSLDRAPGLTESQLDSWEARLGAGMRPLGLD